MNFTTMKVYIEWKDICIMQLKDYEGIPDDRGVSDGSECSNHGGIGYMIKT